MKKKCDDEKERRLILKILESEKKYLSITSISKKACINRHTVAHHLDLLEFFGKVHKIELGSAKKYKSVFNLPISGIIDICSDLIIILNSRLYIQYLNNAATKYFNTTMYSAIGKKLNDMHFSLFSGNIIT